MSTSDSRSVDDLRKSDDDGYVKMVESGHIGFQLAEEVRALREEILSLKQEKRMLLVSNENLEEALGEANNRASTLAAKVAEQSRFVEAYVAETAKQESILNQLEMELKEARSQYSAQRRKSKLLGQELERSLEDEVALRSYARRLESDLSAGKETIQALERALQAEQEERLRCHQFIESTLRYQLVHQKKLETVAFYCDKDVDLTTISILEVSPDYLDNLLRDLRSDLLPTQSTGGGAGRAAPAHYDFAALQHRQRSIEHQLNQYLTSIRGHVSKQRKQQHKSLKYIRKLLEVIHTHEELSATSMLHRSTLHGAHTAWDSECSDTSSHDRPARSPDLTGQGGREHQHHRSKSDPAESGHGRVREGRAAEGKQEHHARLRPTSNTLLGELQDSLRRNFPV